MKMLSQIRLLYPCDCPATELEWVAIPFSNKSYLDISKQITDKSMIEKK